MSGMPIEVEELPTGGIETGTLFSIANNYSERFTHGYFKYPCKFIPEIPRWAIREYGGSSGGSVIDPFCGSGTTLVEAILAGKSAFGVDFDPLSRLLAKVKSTPLSKSQMKIIESTSRFIQKDFEKKIGHDPPEIPNLNLWFSQEAVWGLASLKNSIENYCEKYEDQDVYDFLRICFASVVRPVSNADNQSPKPYVSGNVQKVPSKVLPTFLKVLNKNLRGLHELSKVVHKHHGEIVGTDARSFDVRGLMNRLPNGVSLCVTSPPYINAFDYVRSLKLENLWLELVGKNDLLQLKKKQVGTESISASVYNAGSPAKTGIQELDQAVDKIYEVDKKRSYVVSKYFRDMSENFERIHSVLGPGGKYCLVVGDSRIRNLEIPTHNILTKMGEQVGFGTDTMFSYVIKNPYLRFPRKGRGGLITRDWVIVLARDG